MYLVLNVASETTGKVTSRILIATFRVFPTVVTVFKTLIRTWSGPQRAPAARPHVPVKTTFVFGFAAVWSARRPQAPSS